MWLKKSMDDDPSLNDILNIKFEGWPVLDLHYTGRDFDSSVPTRIMHPLLDAQKEIYRLYCQMTYGEQNLRKLKLRERERLELNVKVDKGSSKYLTNLSETLNEAIKDAAANMESKHILYAVISVSLIWGSNIAWKEWLDNQAKAKEIDSRVQMSQVEKEKLQLLADSYKKEPFIKELSKGVDEFRNHSLHQLKPADSFTVPDTNVEVDGKYASEITTTPREKSVEIRIDGEFVIQSVVSGETDGFKVKVKRVVDNKMITVTIPDGAINAEQKSILKNNEWAKKSVIMEINAKELRGQITTATLVSVSDIKQD